MATVLMWHVRQEFMENRPNQGPVHSCRLLGKAVAGSPAAEICVGKQAPENTLASGTDPRSLF